MKIFKSGFTLIELLVSVVLGMFIVSGFISYYIEQQSTNELLIVDLDIQKKNKTMFTILEYFISQTGYKPSNALNVPYSSIFKNSTISGFNFNAGEVINIVPVNDDSKVSIRYFFDSSARGQDCFGNELTSDAMLQMQFFYDNTSQAVKCRARVLDPITNVVQSDTTETVFSNIAAFKITQVGRENSSSNLKTVDFNVTASVTFSPSLLWLEVVEFSNDYFYRIPTEQTINYLNGTSKKFTSRKRHVYRKEAIVLRNQEGI